MGLRRNKKLKTRLCRKSTGESGGIQAPGACGPGLQGAWGLGCQLGARPIRGLNPFPHKPVIGSPGEGVGVASEVGTPHPTAPKVGG